MRPPSEVVSPPDGDDNDDKPTDRKAVMVPSVNHSETMKPPTGKGHENSRGNAIKFALYSTVAVLPWEDALEDERRYQERRDFWQPVGIEEEEQVAMIHQIRREQQRVVLAVPGVSIRKLMEIVTAKEGSPHAGEFNVFNFKDLAELDVELILEVFAKKKLADLDDLKATRDLVLSMKSELTKARKNKADRRKAYNTVIQDLPPEFVQLWQEKQKELELEEYSREAIDELIRFLRVDAVDHLDRERLKIRRKTLVKEVLSSLALDPDAYAGVDRRMTTLARQYERAVETLLKLQRERKARDA